ncbi:MAG: SEL1-like repeat protein [Methylococcaceae bacterium]|nr:SEL1-like repeat protein [Methylococcaceae bacterium]
MSKIINNDKISHTIQSLKNRHNQQILKTEASLLHHAGLIFARIFDVWWETLLISIVLFTFKYRNPTHFVYWFSDIPISDASLWLICIPLALVSDAILYRFFGNTPGKAWLGLEVKTDDSLPLRFFQYLNRNLKIYVSGLAFGLPIIGFFPMYYQSIRLRKGLQASYDEFTGFRVCEQAVGWLQKATFGLAFACLFSLFSVFNIMGKNTEQQSTLSINQEIPANTNSHSEYQAINLEAISQQANELYKQGRYGEAIPFVIQLAEKNNASWQRLLGEMYQVGQGVTQNYNLASFWYNKAIENEDVAALNNLGAMYSKGEGVTKDYKQALILFKKAADKGDANGQSNLGFMYAEGKGVEQNYSQAAYWFTKAAEKGYAIAQNNLGYFYVYGLGVSKNIDQAVYWLRKAEQQGMSEAKETLLKLSLGSGKQALISETNDTFNADGVNGMKFEIKGNLKKIREEMKNSKFSRIEKPNHESKTEETQTKRECVIKPVMTNAELRNCQN